MRFHVKLPSEEGSEHSARVLLRRRLADRLPAVTLYDLLTVVSELVANAIRYGEGPEIGLSIDVAGNGRVRGEVANQGEGLVRPRPVDSSLTGGLGLHIVDAIAVAWRVETDGVTRVSFELADP